MKQLNKNDYVCDEHSSQRCTGSHSERYSGGRSSCGHDGRHDHTTTRSSVGWSTGCRSVCHRLQIHHRMYGFILAARIHTHTVMTDSTTNSAVDKVGERYWEIPITARTTPWL